MNTTEHEQSRIEITNIHVDARLKDLIQALWDRWLITEWSCQGDDWDGGQKPFIVFPNTHHAIMFSLVLESIPVYYRTEVRSLCCGGGGFC